MSQQEYFMMIPEPSPAFKEILDSNTELNRVFNLHRYAMLGGNFLFDQLRKKRKVRISDYDNATEEQAVITAALVGIDEPAEAIDSLELAAFMFVQEGIAYRHDLGSKLADGRQDYEIILK
jgi:hypothetical protein